MEADLERIERLSLQGLHEEAASQCSALLAAAPRRDHQELLPLLCSTAYLAALSLLQHCGSTRTAERLLRQLGCRHRLADSLLQTVSTESSVGEEAGSEAAFVPLLLGNALQGALYAQLRQGFAPGAQYWAELSYQDPDTPYFSYYYPLAEQPSDAIQAAAQQVHSCLLESPLRQAMRGVVGVEWWAHSREWHAPHQLHFDLNEQRLRQGAASYKLEHPAVSTVLYLSTEGGPTLVLDQTPSSPLGGQGWLCHPVETALLASPGNLLHGVLPGLAGGEAEGGKRRTTLMMAFWTGGMTPRQRDSSPELGPAMPHPSLRSQGAGEGGLAGLPLWLRDFALGGEQAMEEPLESRRSCERRRKGRRGEARRWGLLPSHRPAWVRVSGGGCGGGEVSALPLPPLHFFLQREDEISRTYVL